MKIWLIQHGTALADAVRHLLRPRNGFLINGLVVAIALALPIAGLTVLDNVRPVAEQLAVDPEISIFLDPATSRDQASAMSGPIRGVLKAAHSSGKLEFIPREKALNTLKDKIGMGDVIAALGSNPLPDTYVLKLAGFRDAQDAERVDAIAVALRGLPHIDLVQVDSAWVKRLAALLQLLRMALIILAVTLAVVVIAVVFNTIRLQVMHQAEEIAVSRLLGATDAYISRPFYYSGALLGLAAGLFALAVVALCLQPLNMTITDFAQLYGSTFQLQPLGWDTSAALLTVAAALGLTGAGLSARRHLARAH